MAEPTTCTTRTDLAELLRRSTSGLRDEIVAEACSLGPERASETVVEILEAELSHPLADGTAIRAVHLAQELRLAGAIRVLVRCAEMLWDVDALGRAALTALSRFGTDALDEILAAFERSRSIDGRARLGQALTRAGVKDDRIRTAFVRMLEDDPENAARSLAEHGDRRAVADLSRAFDRLVLAPVADCEICAGEHLLAIEFAMRALGGGISAEQEARLDDVLERAHPLWTMLDPPPEASVRKAAGKHGRPGRNAPCRCGSGKKYKKCHLDEDERGLTQ